MNNELFTDKYLPNTIKEYIGFSHNSVLQYIERVLENTEKKKGMIFHGSAGCGKSVLANLLPDHFDLSSYYTNASDIRKKSQINTDIFRTESLKNKKTLIIFDECDGISPAGFRELERTLKKYVQPTILIANNLEKIPYSIRKICHVEKFSVDRFTLLALANRVVKTEKLDLNKNDVRRIVNHSKSFRSLLHALQFGIGSHHTEQLSTDLAVLYSLQGQSVDISTTDLSDTIIRFNDNSNSPNLIAHADLWNRRYISGYTYGKHIVHAILKSIRNPGIKKLNYPRTYALIHSAKTGKKRIDPSSKKKSSAPKIKILGFK